MSSKGNGPALKVGGERVQQNKAHHKPLADEKSVAVVPQTNLVKSLNPKVEIEEARVSEAQNKAPTDRNATKQVASTYAPVPEKHISNTAQNQTQPHRFQNQPRKHN